MEARKAGLAGSELAGVQAPAGPAVLEAPYTGPVFSRRNRLGRLVWGLVWGALFRTSPRFLHGWRRMLLRCFGAQIGAGSRVYPRARVWAPWNLTLGKVVGIADDVEIYNPSPIVIGDHAVVSQGAYLCGASHDYRRWSFPLVTQRIEIGAQAWIAARAIVHMGVRVGEGAVIGAGSVVTRSVPDWTVCAGNPCRVIRIYEKRHD